MIIEFHLNGKKESINTLPQNRLVNILRDDFGLISTHIGCGNGMCGRCTVLLEDHLAYSCIIPAFKIKGKHIQTFEGFKESESFRDIRTGFKTKGCYPCRQCESTIYLASHTLLETTFRPSEQEIADFMSFIGCSCMDFTTLFAGLMEAGRIREERVDVQ